MILIMYPMTTLLNPWEISFASMQSIMATYPGSSIILATPTWQYTLLFATVIIGFMIWQCLLLDPLNRMKSCVLTTKLKRELKFDNNVFVARETVGGGYLVIKRRTSFFIRAPGVGYVTDCIFDISGRFNY